jgi:hypothetical protein
MSRSGFDLGILFLEEVVVCSQGFHVFVYREFLFGKQDDVVRSVVLRINVEREPLYMLAIYCKRTSTRSKQGGSSTIIVNAELTKCKKPVGIYTMQPNSEIIDSSRRIRWVPCAAIRWVCSGVQVLELKPSSEQSAFVYDISTQPSVCQTAHSLM